MPRNSARADRYHVRLFRATVSLYRAVRQFGGAHQLLRRAIDQVRREGVAGIWRGVEALRSAAKRQGGDGRNDYTAWLSRYGTWPQGSRSHFAACVEGMAMRPLISVIMPVYNPKPVWLEAAIESVRSQFYPNWELCIADDASTDTAIRPLIERYAAMDPRLKATFRERNGHISASSNTALAAASGEWVVLLDHDDLLSEDALFWVADTANRHPDAGLIYSDEDKITEGGIRCVPHFKPDWNYPLFLVYNLICHLGAYRRALVSEVGGFREGYEGAQDYDLALRTVERLKPHQIVHVPRVLYHWRMHATSTAAGAQSKPYARPAGLRALNEHFDRQRLQARAELQPDGYCLPRYGLPEPAPRVSLIVPVSGEHDRLQDFVAALRSGSRYPDVEILLVAARTDAGVRDVVAGAGVVVVQAAESKAMEAAIDEAVAMATGEFVALVDPQLRPQEETWLRELVSLAAQEGVGAVAPRILGDDGKVWAAGLVFGMTGTIGRPHLGAPRGDAGYFHRAVLVQEMSAVPGDCVVMRKSHYESTGGLAEEGLRGLPAQADLCLRLRRAALRNIYAGHVVMQRQAEEYARLGGSAAGYPEHDPVALPSAVRERWAPLLQADPAYNPNLTLEHEDFSLAWPPRVSLLPHVVGSNGVPPNQDCGSQIVTELR